MLVGLQSFAEGLDLKGDLLSQVHIHKIAFPPIDSPVVITEGEWLKSSTAIRLRCKACRALRLT